MVRSWEESGAIARLTKELADWPGVVLNSHKSAGQLYHKLAFLADIGITHSDPGMPRVIDRIFQFTSEEGPFQLVTRPFNPGGEPQAERRAWALCDAPSIVCSLARMGLSNDPRVLKARDYLLELARPNGFPCAVSKELGNWRGPGKKTDPCPYATLLMLKLISVYPDLIESRAAQDSVECLLHLWENSRTLKPYIFYMGTDFRKLKAPFIWYDILHVADTLSYFPQARTDPRYRDMISHITAKAGPDGRYTPESVWQAWKEWDFGQKKVPSDGLTWLIDRMIRRIL